MEFRDRVSFKGAVALVVIGGLKRIAAITEKVVPFMVILSRPPVTMTMLRISP